MRILWLLPDFGYNAAARQAVIVCPKLFEAGHSVIVAGLRAGGAMAHELRLREIPTIELAAPADMPVKCLLELDRLLKDEAFEVVHTWRLPAARAMGTSRLARSHRPKLLVSQARRGAKWNPLDRMLLARVDCLAADLGEDGPKMPRVPLAVELPSTKPWPRQLGIPQGARVIASLGEFTTEHNFRDAIWAFDVLKFIYADLHLVIIGDGPERDALQKFGREVTGASDRIHFLTDRTDGPALLANAEVVWVPSRRRCGEQVALEAQAAGVPVVATNLPGLAEVCRQGQSGVLVPPGEPVELSKATRPILDNPERRQELINAGRQSIRSGHSAFEVAKRWLDVYTQLAGSRPSV